MRATWCLWHQHLFLLAIYFLLYVFCHVVMWFHFGLDDLQVDKVPFLTSPTICYWLCKDDQKVSAKLKSIFSQCVCWCSLIVTTDKEQHILVLYERLFFFFLFNRMRQQWLEVSCNRFIIAQLWKSLWAELFVCRCWSLKDCCWLIAASLAGGCSPCMGCTLQWLDLPRPQTCGNAALTSWLTCDVWTNQRDKL